MSIYLANTLCSIFNGWYSKNFPILSHLTLITLLRKLKRSPSSHGVRGGDGCETPQAQTRLQSPCSELPPHSLSQQTAGFPGPEMTSVPLNKIPYGNLQSEDVINTQSVNIHWTATQPSSSRAGSPLRTGGFEKDEPGDRAGRGQVCGHLSCRSSGHELAVRCPSWATPHTPRPP